jgi:hypothetical protein
MAAFVLTSAAESSIDGDPFKIPVSQTLSMKIET